MVTDEIVEWAGEMLPMVEAQAKLVEEHQWISGPTSYMAVLGLERDEVRNCRMLRWLLDPLAAHGFGAGLVEAFAAAAGLKIGDDGDTATIETEVGQTGTDHDADSTVSTRADLVITTASHQIVVEAKIDAPEGPRQGLLLERHWPDADALVFLTRRGNSVPGSSLDRSRWTPMSWKQVATMVLETVADAEIVDVPAVRDARETARLWATTARRYL